MDFWPEFLASSWGKEFVAGGFGGVAGIVSGYPLDTLRIHQQHSPGGSTVRILRNIVADGKGPLSLYRGMAAPLASVTFQNAMAFQIYAILSRAFDSSASSTMNPSSNPPSYKGALLGGIGTGAIQSLMLTPVELVKIRLQLQGMTMASRSVVVNSQLKEGPVSMVKSILQAEGLRGIYRGFTITVLRDAPAHGVYFWTYEYARECLHPGCRKTGQESFKTMLMAGGLAGVASWICCYPLDVIKTRIQAQPESPSSSSSSSSSSMKYRGIVDCFRKSVSEDGYKVLWRGLGTAVMRAFIVNGTVFTAYETSLRFINNNNNTNGNNNN